MMLTETKFFSLAENKQVLQKLLRTLPDDAKENGQAIACASHLRSILKEMTDHAVDFEQHCQQNIQWIGKDFISAAQRIQANDQGEFSSESIQKLFVMAYRFLCEVDFWMARDPYSEFWLTRSSVETFVEENLDTFSPDLKRRLVWAHYIMPAHIIKTMLNPNLQSIKDFNERYDSASKLKADWDAEVEEKQERVNALRAQLDKLETEYNFVGLEHGFRKLIKQKKWEKFWAFCSILCLGLLAIAPVSVELWFIFKNKDVLDTYQQRLLLGLLPLLTLEVLLVYFFRIVLAHFRSIKAQLLQLELRSSLCQFVESYATFVSDIKTKNASALEKFENQIFSGLISSEENLPSTFDGTEQLAKLIKSIKGSS